MDHFRMHGVYLTGVFMSLVGFIACGNECDVTMIKPTHYLKEYEHLTVDVELSLTSKEVINGQDQWAPIEVSQGKTGLNYGRYNRPPDVFTSTKQVTDSAHQIHQVKMGLNGTHVCIGVNHVTMMSDGGTSQDCKQQCGPALVDEDGGGSSSSIADPWPKIEILANPVATPPKYDYLVVKTSKVHQTRKVRCYNMESGETDTDGPEAPSEDCELNKRCVITVSAKELSEPMTFQAMCQPDGLTCSDDEEECQADVEAPHVDTGTHARVCNYCCWYDKCNDIRNCSSIDGTCMIYGEPLMEEGNSTFIGANNPTGDDGTGSKSPKNGFKLHIIVMLCVFTILLIVH